MEEIEAIEEARSRVKLGIKFLKRTLPIWQRFIRTDILDVGHIKCCVLAQIFGDYNQGVTSLGLSVEQRVCFGFELHGRFRGKNGPTVKDLNQAWCEALEQLPKVTNRAGGARFCFFIS